VSQDNREEFIDAIYRLSHARGRNGAYQWGIYEDTEGSGHFMEDSWAARLHHIITESPMKINYYKIKIM